MRSPATRAVATRWSDCLQRRGELVACKVFRGDVSAREEVARQREFRAMTQLKHQNIVRFIAVEQEVQLFLSLSLSLSLLFSADHILYTPASAQPLPRKVGLNAYPRTFSSILCFLVQFTSLRPLFHPFRSCCFFSSLN